MLRLCNNCGRLIKMNRPICQPCWAKISPKCLLEPGERMLSLEEGRHYSIFKYTGWAKELCRRIKLKGDLGALWCLLDLIQLDEECIYYIKKCDLVIPTPSSLYSRIRGRLDIAASLCRFLELNINVNIVYLPRWAYLWRLQKRSIQRQKSDWWGSYIENYLESVRAFCAQRWPFQHTLDGLRVLVVDDIATTGSSLQEVAGFLKASEVCFLTVFRASSYSRSQGARSF